MKNVALVPYNAADYSQAIQNFIFATFDIGITYSLSHVAQTENIPEKSIIKALRKALKISVLAGINNKQHFKKIFIYDPQLKTVIQDWKLSRNGLNLVVMYLPLTSTRRARWLWKLSTL